MYNRPPLGVLDPTSRHTPVPVDNCKGITLYSFKIYTPDTPFLQALALPGGPCLLVSRYVIRSMNDLVKQVSMGHTSMIPAGTASWTSLGMSYLHAGIIPWY